jgi:hypothetical protein
MSPYNPDMQKKRKPHIVYNSPDRFSYADLIAAVFILLFVGIVTCSAVTKDDFYIKIIEILIVPITTILGGYFGQQIASSYFMSKSTNGGMYGMYGGYGGMGGYGTYDQTMMGGTGTYGTYDQGQYNQQNNQQYDQQYNQQGQQYGQTYDQYNQPMMDNSMNMNNQNIQQQPIQQNNSNGGEI